MDEFKKYIRSQKDPLESEVPSERVWSGIRESFDAPVKKMPLHQWAIAASIILLAGVGLFILRKPNEPSNTIVKSVIKEINTPVVEDNTSKSSIASGNKIETDKPLHFPAAAPITTIHTVKEMNVVDESKLNSMEASFTQVINIQKARISTTPLYAESPTYFSDFHNQLYQMDKDEAQIKSYIKKNGISDELLEQMINVYQQKLNMLKQLQTEMQKLNSRYKQNRPAVDTLKTYFLNL
jgi:hypothetical protein